MELGTRRIRSSGRGSGSIEITLPSRLRALSGLACRVSWSDAPVPQIVLAPDLAAARAALGRFWALLLRALELPSGPPPPFDLRLAAGGMPALRWEDALTLAGPGAQDAAVISRILCAMASLAQPVPAGFAVSLAFIATGAVPGADHRDDCAIAAAAFTPRAAAPLDGLGDPLWQATARQAGPLLALQRALAANPARHQALREAARAGSALDLRGLLP